MSMKTQGSTLHHKPPSVRGSTVSGFMLRTGCGLVHNVGWPKATAVSYVLVLCLMKAPSMHLTASRIVVRLAYTYMVVIIMAVLKTGNGARCTEICLLPYMCCHLATHPELIGGGVGHCMEGWGRGWHGRGRQGGARGLLHICTGCGLLLRWQANLKKK